MTHHRRNDLIDHAAESAREQVHPHGDAPLLLEFPGKPSQS